LLHFLTFAESISGASEIYAENKKYLQNLLEESTLACSKVTLRKLATDLVSKKQFNALKFQLDNSNVKTSEIIFNLIDMWISSKGNEATLANFEKTLRDHDLNSDAGN